MLNKYVIKIAFLGPKGSYSHTAATQYAHRYLLNQTIKEHSCRKFRDIFTLVEHHQVEYGILPLENSNSGIIHEVFNLLLNTKLILVGEITIPIKHCILVNHCTSAINQIQIVYSHYQPIQQCSKFLRNFSSWKIILCESSSYAIATVAKLNQANTAALGSIQGGSFYGLRPILSHNLSNRLINTTKFIILKHNTKIKTESTYCYFPTKIMLIIFIDQKSNTVYTIIKILKLYDITIVYLKSYKLSYSQLKHIILLEITAHLNDKKIQQALIQLRKISIFLKILGCYSNKPNNYI